MKKARKMDAAAAPIEVKIPAHLEYIPAEGKGFGDGPKRIVKWGWREWRALAPRLEKHVKKAGRHGLAQQIREAQHDLIAPELHRTTLAIATACTPNAKPDVLEVIALAAAMGKESPRLALVMQQGKPEQEKQPEAEQPDPHRMSEAVLDTRRPIRKRAHQGKGPKGYLTLAETMKRARCGESTLWRWLKQGEFASMIEGQRRFVEAASLDAFLAARQKPVPAAQKPQEAAQPAPLPMPSAAPPAALAPDLAAWQALPLGALIPGLKAFIAEQVERHAQIMGRAIAASMARQGRQKPAGAAQASEPSAPPPAAAAAPLAPLSPAGLVLEGEEEQREAKEEKEERPRKLSGDFAEQIEVVARAIGIEPPASVIDKKCVLIVGIHPTVEQRVEREYGRFFDFRFKRPDAFNSSNDIPASADAVLIARKPHLPSEITGTMRRLQLFNKKISNDMASVFWALRDFHPEAVEGMRAPQ